ncbi:MAG: hypothetical protein FWE36_01215 [Erysipelotrichales bacterium]|nr:hypothetical protein [Erysipelotrichales bacterium]
MKKLIFLAICCFGVLTIPNLRANSYIYSSWGRPIHSAEGFAFSDNYYDRNIDPSGNHSFSGRLADLRVGGDYLYLLDERTIMVNDQGVTISTNNNSRIFVLDSNLQFVKVIDHFYRPYLTETGGARFSLQPVVDNNGEVILDGNGEPLLERRMDLVRDTFNQAQGLFITPNNIFVADTENNRIIKLDLEGNFVYTYDEITDSFTEYGYFGTPNDPTFRQHADDDGVAFRPSKIVVDTTNRMYVIALMVFEGILEFDEAGEFSRFVGTNRVHLTPIQIFWRRFQSEEQIRRDSLRLPQQFINLTIDERNFLWATSMPIAQGHTNDHIIQSINPSGVDVLRNNGFARPRGDLEFSLSAGVFDLIYGPSRFGSITLDGRGNYTVLDTRRGRLFTYDFEGNLLFITGQMGNQTDSFGDPVAVVYFQDQLLVVDRQTSSLIAFGFTEFGRLVTEATQLERVGNMTEAAEVWREVIRRNSNFEIAYTGIARVMMDEGRFAEARHYFRLGNNWRGYSRALNEQRFLFIDRHFNTAMGIFLVGAAAVTGFLIYRGVKKGKFKSHEGSEY